MVKLIHIGWPKCASSFIQSGIFPLLETQAFHLPTKMLHGDEYDRERFIAYVSEKVDLDKPYILSREAMSMKGTMMADRLAECFPDAHIMAIVRDQRSWLVSLYCHVILNSCTGLSTFDQFVTSFLNDKVQTDRLQYCELLGYYRKAFSKDRVHVVPFELLKQDSKEFVSRFLLAPQPASFWEALGALKPSNTSSNKVGLLKANRLLNYPHSRLRRLLDRFKLREGLDMFVGEGKAAYNKGSTWKQRRAIDVWRSSISFRKSLNRLLAKVYADSEKLSYSTEQTQAMQALYGKTNARLMDEFDLPLDRLGYCLER